MNPYLEKERHPRIKVEVYLSSWTLVNCFIDTGFAGGISLPKRFQNYFKLRKPITYLEFILADGSTKLYPIYEIIVKYKNKRKTIPINIWKRSTGRIRIFVRL